jgi:hypothetical protein
LVVIADDDVSMLAGDFVNIHNFHFLNVLCCISAFTFWNTLVYVLHPQRRWFCFSQMENISSLLGLNALSFLLYIIVEIFIKDSFSLSGVVVHSWNPSDFGGRDRRPALAKAEDLL